MNKSLRKRPMSNSYETRVLRVLKYIHDNPGGDMSLDRLADVAAMSRFHWHRVFHAMTGETCAQTVRRVRLHHAATMLLQTDRTIKQIAIACGYSNEVSFARLFAETYNARPTAFRTSSRRLPPFYTPKPGEFPMYPITTRTEPARRLAMLPHKGAYDNIGKVFEAFLAICQSRSLWPQMGPIIGVYFDNPEITAQADLNSLAGAEWLGQDIPEGMQEHHLAGGKSAVLTYKGAYSGIGTAYQTLFGDWLPKSGEEPADAPCYEIALNNPNDTKPEDLLTEICLPLK